MIMRIKLIITFRPHVRDVVKADRSKIDNVNFESVPVQGALFHSEAVEVICYHFLEYCWMIYNPPKARVSNQCSSTNIHI